MTRKWSFVCLLNARVHRFSARTSHKLRMAGEESCLGCIDKALNLSCSAHVSAPMCGISVEAEERLPVQVVAANLNTLEMSSLMCFRYPIKNYNRSSLGQHVLLRFSLPTAASLRRSLSSVALASMAIAKNFGPGNQAESMPILPKTASVAQAKNYSGSRSTLSNIQQCLVDG